MRTVLISALVLGALNGPAWAQSTNETPDEPGKLPAGSLGQVADDVTNNLQGLSKVVVVPSYAAGAAYGTMGVMKIKREHKNPTRRR